MSHKGTKRSQALRFFKSAQKMDSEKSPYDYEKKDFLEVKGKDIVIHRSAGAVFLIDNINKVTRDGFKEHLNNLQARGKKREKIELGGDVGEQRTEEAAVQVPTTHLGSNWMESVTQTPDHRTLNFGSDNMSWKEPKSESGVSGNLHKLLIDHKFEGEAIVNIKRTAPETLQIKGSSREISLNEDELQRKYALGILKIEQYWNKAIGREIKTSVEDLKVFSDDILQPASPSEDMKMEADGKYLAQKFDLQGMASYPSPSAPLSDHDGMDPGRIDSPPELPSRQNQGSALAAAIDYNGMDLGDNSSPPESPAGQNHATQGRYEDSSALMAPGEGKNKRKKSISNPRLLESSNQSHPLYQMAKRKRNRNRLGEQALLAGAAIDLDGPNNAPQIGFIAPPVTSPSYDPRDSGELNDNVDFMSSAFGPPTYPEPAAPPPDVPTYAGQFGGLQGPLPYTSDGTPSQHFDQSQLGQDRAPQPQAGQGYELESFPDTAFLESPFEVPPQMPEPAQSPQNIDLSTNTFRFGILRPFFQHPSPIEKPTLPPRPPPIRAQPPGRGRPMFNPGR